jgi:hypothetical protein
MHRFAAAALVSLPLIASAQQADTAPAWSFRHRLELRGNYRNSNEERFRLRFPFPPSFLPVGETSGFLQTVDGGSHLELSVAQVRLDADYGNWFGAHAQLHARDRYRANPTSADRQMDADELWLRFGRKPEFLDRPDGTSVFLLMGKFPKMERQPVRVLESYGLAATAFNRFEDVGVMAGGTIGRSLYWRATATSGNPLYFRDSNALAGDNGIRELLQPNPDPDLKSGFPILYNAETEDYFLKTGNVQFGQALGYRWMNEAQNAGFDAIVFHYRRAMPYTEELTGTFYGANLDLLDGPNGANVAIPTSGNKKEEIGARVYGEWRSFTAIVQFTDQKFAGLGRQGEELEIAYRYELPNALSIQPAVRWSALQNDFKGPPTFPAPSIWWNWVKVDAGVRIGFGHKYDLTIERAMHNVAKPPAALPKKIDLSETLVTVRVRV